MLPLSENALDEMVARERERGAPPLTDWTSLSARLRTEGLMKPASSSGFISRGWMQAAAGLVLAVGGAAVGRMTAGTSAIPASSQQTASISDAQASATPVSAQQDPAASAAPVAAPMNPVSEIGVSMTRSGPNFASSPSVAPKMPP